MAYVAILEKHLQELAANPSALQARAQALLAAWENPPTDVAEWLALSVATERVVKIGVAGHADNTALIAQLAEVEPREWKNIAALPIDAVPQNRVGEQLMNSMQLHPSVLWPQQSQLRISYSAASKQTAEHSLQHCLNHGIVPDMVFDDPAFLTALVQASSTEQTVALADFSAKRFEPITHAIYANTKPSPESVTGRDEPAMAEKFKQLAKAQAAFDVRRVNGEVNWVLTRIPSQEEAQKDGATDYAAYLQHFFESCDQPWAEIEKSQAKLIEVFDRARHLHFTNSDGTDVQMSIEGQEFANSVTGRNIPGSEFFSAPVAGTTEGVIVAQGKFIHAMNGRDYEMSNLRFVIKNGEVVEGYAEQGQDALDMILDLEDHLDPDDPRYRGSRRFGEIGIGTNQYQTEHSCNSLLVEKICGSFHMALGHCYGNVYNGKPTRIGNGLTESAIHWDITTMLRGKDGEMWLDGHLLQKNGKWLPCAELGIEARDIAVLNEGWAAIPESRRPKYWNDKLKNQDQQQAR